jgi:hypothetical protein
MGAAVLDSLDQGASTDQEFNPDTIAVRRALAPGAGAIYSNHQSEASRCRTEAVILDTNILAFEYPCARSPSRSVLAPSFAGQQSREFGAAN